MKRADFSFDLPDELIAQTPAPKRGGSRLLVAPPAQGEFLDYQFGDVLDFLREGDLLVVNNTRVLPARFFGKKVTGGRVEFLLERLESDGVFLAQTRTSKKLKADAVVTLDGGLSVRMLGREGPFSRFRLESDELLEDVLESIGHMPLPPYIQREDALADKERYQTVYADQPGAVAAPTAGLHFDDELLSRIRRKGVDIASVTLHVGAGTFKPVLVDDIREHKMHSERFSVSEQTAGKMRSAGARGGRVFAVGTTTVRVLESVMLREGEMRASSGETDIFIYPGYHFSAVDALVTNFHLPESTLLMMVCAFAGQSRVLAAYEHAVRERYRFFSYGDAMLLFHEGGNEPHAIHPVCAGWRGAARCAEFSAR